MLYLLAQQVVKHPHSTNPVGGVIAGILNLSIIILPIIAFIWLIRVLCNKHTFNFVFRDETPEPPPHNNDYEWAERQKPR